MESASQHQVFVSYRSIDNEPPPEGPKDGGFVNYLLKQIRYVLRQRGVPAELIWIDRERIQPGHRWSEAIGIALGRAELFLAVLSRNYVQSGWCELELNLMASRIEALENDPGHLGPRRIFRVDKHSVPEEKIPQPLRELQAVKFYSEDEENRDLEYFWRGEVQRKDAYIDAVDRIARAIEERFTELGVPLEPVAAPLDVATAPSNGRTVFVAKPAADVVEEYSALTRELHGLGFRITPDVDQDLPKDGEKVRAVVTAALHKAEVSIHLLGERTGGRPVGLDVDLVSLQLRSAAIEAERRQGFKRLIWAPSVVSRLPFSEEPVTNRDPLRVVDRFDHRLESDQIDSDTASRFNEFVLQHLGKTPRLSTSKIDDVYIRCASEDRPYCKSIALALKQSGFAPRLESMPPERTSDEFSHREQNTLSRIRRVIICWGSQTRTQILTEVSDPGLLDWRAKKRGRLILLLIRPASEEKAEIAEIGYGTDIDHIIDVTQEERFDVVPSSLTSALGR